MSKNRSYSEKKKTNQTVQYSKTYRMIALLNCLNNVSKKIMTTRLSYWAETINLLHHEQINNKKQRLIIDAAMCLTHDIQ